LVTFEDGGVGQGGGGGDAGRAIGPVAGRPAADAAGYTITVEDGGTPVVLERSDTTMTRAFADLLDWIERHGSPPAL
jgi:hypothetical protein